MIKKKTFTKRAHSVGYSETIHPEYRIFESNLKSFYLVTYRIFQQNKYSFGS